MKTRQIEEQDLGELWEWYRGHGWVSERCDDVFPSRGYIVDDHAALWLYVDRDAPIGWVAFQVINPQKNKALAVKALHLLYERVDQEAQQMGLMSLMQTVSHSSLKKMALQHNYTLGDAGLSSYMKRL